LRLKIIGNETGARESFFKTKEGIPGDGVCTLYDTPDKKLRLYCIRYGKQLIIIGAGGQYIFVVPSLNAVVVITSGNFRNGKTQQPELIFEQYILPELLE